MLGALGRVVSFEAGKLPMGAVYVSPTLTKFTVHKYIDPSVSKLHVGSFRVAVIHLTMSCKMFK